MPGPTQFVLDTLKAFQAKATFFCIGENIQKHPTIFNEIVENGHTIGNHTFNHLKGWSATVDEYITNVKLCDSQREIGNGKPAGNTRPILFRPPYGRITPKQIKALHEYKIVMWDVLSLDYRQSGKDDVYLKGTIQATRPGSIVVFHDSLKADKKLRFMLPRYLEHFSNLGYQFKSL